MISRTNHPNYCKGEGYSSSSRGQNTTGGETRMSVTYIEGIVTLEDGSKTHFSIGQDLGWQQWGNDPSKLGQTVDLMESLTEASHEHFTEDGS